MRSRVPLEKSGKMVFILQYHNENGVSLSYNVAPIQDHDMQRIDDLFRLLPQTSLLSRRPLAPLESDRIGVAKVILAMLRSVVTLQCLGWIAVCSAGDPVEKLSVEQTEKARNHIQISGGYIIAAMSGVEYKQPDLSSFHVHLTDTGKSLLCFRIASIDGVYLAEPAYDISDTRPGLYALSFQSKMKKLLAGYSDAELAITAWSENRDCSKAGAAPKFIAGWGHGISDGAVSVMVNASENGAQLVFAKQEDRSTELRAVDCNEIPGNKERQRLFDRVCTFNRKAIPEASTAWLRIFDIELPYDLDALEISLKPTPIP